MKKLISILLIMALFGVVLVTPAQAVTRDLMVEYIYAKNPSVPKGLPESVGGYNYWKSKIENKEWVGENRPEPLMGDATIDGKVDARDALFALHFTVNGNIQTFLAMMREMSPGCRRWAKYYLKDEEEIWLEYCYYNSPFFADVTKDCCVNSLDALQILKYSVGKAKNFPVGDFTTINEWRMYYPWPTEYYRGIFTDLTVQMTDEEFRAKYNFYPDATPTDQ